MLYQMYQAFADVTDPLRAFAKAAVPVFGSAQSWLATWQTANQSLLRALGGACEVTALAGLTHERPPFGIDSVINGARELDVTEVPVHRTPFCTLLRFHKAHAAPGQPKVLVVAPVSGHFATLLRGTVHTLLQDHDVYITDWHNIRDVPAKAGPFDLDEFIDHVIDFIALLGPDVHVVSVCQPTVPTLAAVALMAAENHPAQPRTMTLMAGPIDTRVNPTEVNKLATGRPIEWFERNLIGRVPLRYAGARRRVYPGFLQITAFMAMNPGRHVQSFFDLYAHLLREDADKAGTIRDFYAEYFAIMDLPAEFYLQTVRDVFQEHLLPQGKMQSRGRTINPAAIKRTALFTIEGERDDICAVGQTVAAQDLCNSLPLYKKKHHVQTGVGHYGVFSGRRWEKEVYPLIRDFIHDFAG